MWFNVDKEGLAKLAARRGKVFVLHELLQNAWDADGVSEVRVKLEPVAGRPLAKLHVEDDAPDGFKNLTHAYTLFAESEKKGNAEKRGRFNLGEKLVLALCESAEIMSTTGGVRFDDKGRHTLRGRLSHGSSFSALIRMTREEMDEVLQAVRLVIPPAGSIDTWINGELLKPPEACGTESAKLPTDTADADGYMYRTVRRTHIRIYKPRDGERPHLFEMGIPVMELPDDAFHVLIRQKIPLSMERDAVTPAYLQTVRAHVVNTVAADLTPEQATAKWVTDGLAHKEAHPQAVRQIITKRFGELAVIADPSDREAENIAKSQGYTVVSGGSLPADVWENVRRAEALKPAGQVTPSPKPFHPDGDPLKLIVPEDWTADMKDLIGFICQVAAAADMPKPMIDFTRDSGWGFGGAYGGGHMTINLANRPADWCARTNRQHQLRFIIHELGHHYGHHLESSYHDALCRIGAAAALLASRCPELFRV